MKVLIVFIVSCAASLVGHAQQGGVVDSIRTQTGDAEKWVDNTLNNPGVADSLKQLNPLDSIGASLAGGKQMWVDKPIDSLNRVQGKISSLNPLDTTVNKTTSVEDSLTMTIQSVVNKPLEVQRQVERAPQEFLDSLKRKVTTGIDDIIEKPRDSLQQLISKPINKLEEIQQKHKEEIGQITDSQLSDELFP